MRWDDDPEFSIQAQCHQKDLYKKEVGKEEDMVMIGEFSDEAESQGTQVASRS